ncbi:MAG: ABC transporter ATP-binding protein [Anaerolineales bacterium]|nr:ABC transporter ATP-binding protein [Anaerolineales bacterium]
MLRPALNGINLTVGAGEFVVLLGPSGCGKTTLVKMVNRLHDPTSGDILLDGQSIYAGMDVIALRRKIGYVIQQTGLFPHMTAAENIAVVPRLLKWPHEKIQPRVDELMEMVSLPPAEFRDRYPAQMSGGQQQRVGVARALAGDPGVILMDEPFGAIDAITRAELQASLLQLQRRLHKTILFVTHDVEEALRLADKIAILRDGDLVQTGSPLEILTQPKDAFIAQLVGADDTVRQLGLVRVEKVMAPLSGNLPPNLAHTIHLDQSLRLALSDLVKSNVDYLTVVNSKAEPVGTISFNDIRSAIG